MKSCSFLVFTRTIGLLSMLTLLCFMPACTTEGHTAQCEAGGQGNRADDGCFTPIGGTCLTHDEFVKGRPNNPDAEPPEDPEADWIEYKKQRKLCDFGDE